MTGELIVKAGGRSIPAGRQVARVMSQVFAQQEASGSRSFRRWDRDLQAALFPPILSLLRRAAAKHLDEATDLRDLAAELVAAAQVYAQATAGEVNDTTGRWVEEGRQDESIFGPSRAATVGITAGNWATQEGKAIAGAFAGKTRLRWRCGPKPCPGCVKMRGKTVKIGQQFTLPDGTKVDHPPAHPNCTCDVEVV